MTKTRAISRRRFYSSPRHHSRGKMTISLAVVAGLMPLGMGAYNDFQAGGAKLAGQGMLARLTGINVNANKWDGGTMMREGLGPIVAGILVHKFIGGSLGINRALGRAGIPLLRI
jgi:hypothetical protein